jgi:hypothetical protein
MASIPHSQPSQASLDWLLGPASKKVYKVRDLKPILGLERDSIIGLHDSGELWGHEHNVRGNGSNTTRIATRDSVLHYLVKTATYDDALREQRMIEALKTIQDRACLLRIRNLLNQII